MKIFGDRVQIMVKDKLPFSSSGLLARLRGAKYGKFLLSMMMLLGIPEMGGFVMAQDQQNSEAIPLTAEEFQSRIKSKNVGPFIAKLDLALEKSPSDPALLGLELQVAQYLLINDRPNGMNRFRVWIPKLEKLPRSATIDKLLVAGVFNATVVQDATLAKEFISWIDTAIGRIPSGESVTEINLKGNRLSLQGLIEDNAQVESEFNKFFSELETLVAQQSVPVSVLASQAMRYKSMFWNSNREQTLKNVSRARQVYIEFMKQGNVVPTDVLVYIQFMTTLANEISKELPRESFGVLNELRDQLRVVQPRLPEEQKNGLESTIKSIEQGLKQLEVAIRQLDLIGTQAPALADAQFVDVPQELQRELKGKIVLLVFWAAWSEPCLKSLERIEQIRNEFQDKEIVVIGVTKSYGMVWDDSSKTIDRQAEVSAEDELKALRSIVEHYKAKISIAVVPDSSKLFEQYQVAGIPQLVLVDANGIVKLVRPGLTENHFKSLETELVNLTEKK
jgi:thiol-disulfide isomerase/thioredoxin/uncharacterized short protein YbdD (DUF466 family)